MQKREGINENVNVDPLFFMFKMSVYISVLIYMYWKSDHITFIEKKKKLWSPDMTRKNLTLVNSIRGCITIKIVHLNYGVAFTKTIFPHRRVAPTEK